MSFLSRNSIAYSCILQPNTLYVYEPKDVRNTFLTLPEKNLVLGDVIEICNPGRHNIFITNPKGVHLLQSIYDSCEFYPIYGPLLFPMGEGIKISPTERFQFIYYGNSFPSYKWALSKIEPPPYIP